MSIYPPEASDLQNGLCPPLSFPQPSTRNLWTPHRTCSPCFLLKLSAPTNTPLPPMTPSLTQSFFESSGCSLFSMQPWDSQSAHRSSASRAGRDYCQVEGCTGEGPNSSSSRNEGLQDGQTQILKDILPSNPWGSGGKKCRFHGSPWSSQDVSHPHPSD